MADRRQLFVEMSKYLEQWADGKHLAATEERRRSVANKNHHAMGQSLTWTMYTYYKRVSSTNGLIER